MASLEKLIAQPASSVKRSLVSDSQTTSSDDPAAETSFSSFESKEKPKIPFFTRIRRRNVPKQRGSPASKKEFGPERETISIKEPLEPETNEVESIASDEIYSDPPVPESPESSLSCPSVKSQYSSTEREVDVASNLTKTKMWTQQRDYWKNVVLKRSVQLGPKHIRTAEALMELGYAYLLCEVGSWFQKKYFFSDVGLLTRRIDCELVNSAGVA
jgi:hypothetical protein